MAEISETVALECEDGIGIIRINNPPVNALSRSVRDGLYAAIQQADGDEGVSAILIICEGKTYIAGAEYTIADMAIWPWYGQLVLGRLYDAAEFLDVASYKNVMRWAEAIDARPAVTRGRMVNRSFGEPAMQLHERHDASDFELRTQDKLEPAAE